MTFEIERLPHTTSRNARSRAASSVVLFALGLMLTLPVQASAHEGFRTVEADQQAVRVEQSTSMPIGAPISDGIFREQLKAVPTQEQATSRAPAGSSAAAGCEAILAGPRRAQALSSGDCTELGGEELLLDGPVTVTPEPTTLAMLILPASLILLSLMNFRRTRQRA